MKVTIYDVAEKAGVSIATVSKAINNTGSMRESTRKRILNVIEEMNYRPSITASALSGKGTKTFGLLVPDISNPFFSAIARRIEDCAYEEGMSVIICSTDDNPHKEKKYLDTLYRKGVDAFIVASDFHNEKLLKTFLNSEIPIVMLAYDGHKIDASRVSVDDFKGGYIAASHLLEKGHKNIGIIIENTESSKLRLYGYQEAFKDFGISTSDDYLIKTSASIENGRDCFNRLYNNKNINPPTAIFACNDLLAIGVIQGATAHQLKIPDDLAVIGFDNTILATTTVPGLTTISQPIEDMGDKIVSVLIEEINNKNSAKRRILFNPELIIRGTT